ncbi:MAG: DUF4105 domain-containing protein [Muribaculaceae bacterium]|nr:DUF4105 domain-containing protein [Muribaculaceae bacterium]
MKGFVISVLISVLYINTGVAMPYDSDIWKNLLHYDKGRSLINSDSSFFLSGNGYKLPESEYFETINQLQNSDLIGDNSIQCRYPARTRFILQHNPELKISHQNCDGYQEFINKVPIDKIEVAFAAENTMSPMSMMGHTFLILSGTHDGLNRKHAFGYSAFINDINPAGLVFNGLFFGLDGVYGLLPYDDYKSRYLLQENRSIWKFCLDLTSEQIDRLKEHLWELNQQQIKYTMLFHNCNTATVSLLKIMNDDYSEKTIKPFSTPLESIQYLYNKGYLSDIALEPTDSTKQVISEYGLNNILDVPRPMRFSLGYEKSGLSFEFSPVYQDIRDSTDAYFDMMESKMGAMSGRIIHGHGIVLDSVEFIKARSIVDYRINKKFSKYINIGFENRPLSRRFRLYPNVQFGAGQSIHIKLVRLYFLPTVSYKYTNKSNVYITPEIGAISQMSNKIRLLVSYNSNIDITGKWNKYDFVQANISYNPTGRYDIFINAKYYPNMGDDYRISGGVALHF